MMRRARILLFFTLLFFYAAPVSAGEPSSETIWIPGDIQRICSYTHFFYPFSSDDFIYYLNDRLLFSDPPDEKLSETGFRSQLLKIPEWHRTIDYFIRQYGQKEDGMITFQLSSREGFQQASVLLNLLGLRLNKDEGGKYRVSRNPSPQVTDYFRFAGIEPGSLEIQLNKSHRFHFKLVESRVPFPLDLAFIGEITGRRLEASSFFETMLGDERFSLLLGILYRLSVEEIDYIGHLIRAPRLAAWKQIYGDKKFLMGLYVLSAALRVEGGRLVLPGGAEAGPVWSELAGTDLNTNPFEFLHRLCTRDDGKLNYLYVFAFFMPEHIRKVVLCDYDAGQMLALYHQISLLDKEELKPFRFPRLRNDGLYTLFYALTVKNGKIWLPQGYRLREDFLPPLLTALLSADSKSSRGTAPSRKFVTICTRFSRRPQLLSPQVQGILNRDFDRYSILIDFVEKIPLRTPEAVIRLFDWVRMLDSLKGEDRESLTAIFQSLLEIFSRLGKYAPRRFDYDGLIGQMVQLPLDRSRFYDAFFPFLQTRLHIPQEENIIDEAFLDFVLAGVGNKMVEFQYADYEFPIKERCKRTIRAVWQSQETAPLSDLLRINRLLDMVSSGDGGADPKIADQLFAAFWRLPSPQMSAHAPQALRSRLIAYTEADLTSDLKKLWDLMEAGETRREDRSKMIARLKGDYLLPHLRHYLLTTAYALNAGGAELKIFRNPNLVRLHDFSKSAELTPWNSCGTSNFLMDFSGYYLRGGLSRLNHTMSAAWVDQLFASNYIYNREQVKGLLVNIMDCCPLPLLTHRLAFDALLVDFGLELLRRGRESEEVRRDLLGELRTVTAGFHYRKAMDYLHRRTDGHSLFFSEIRRLGERFYRRRKYLDQFPAADELSAFTRPPLSHVIEEENRRRGGIYARTFGSLRPLDLSLFPQELSNLLDSGCTAGEMMDEFKIKLGYHLYKKKVPSCLLGQLVYSYIQKTGRRLLNQNHVRDYYSVYFLFDIFNGARLEQLLKRFKTDGYLRIR
jgi:hypothetical protein